MASASPAGIIGDSSINIIDAHSAPRWQRIPPSQRPSRSPTRQPPDDRAPRRAQGRLGIRAAAPRRLPAGQAVYDDPIVFNAMHGIDVQTSTSTPSSSSSSSSGMWPIFLGRSTGARTTRPGGVDQTRRNLIGHFLRFACSASCCKDDPFFRFAEALLRRVRSVTTSADRQRRLKPTSACLVHDFHGNFDLVIPALLGSTSTRLLRALAWMAPVLPWLCMSGTTPA